MMAGGGGTMAVLLKTVRRDGPPHVWELLPLQGIAQVDGEVRVEVERREEPQ